MTRVHIVEVEKARRTKKNIDTAWTIIGRVFIALGIGAVVGIFIWLFNLSIVAGGVILAIVVVLGGLGTLVELESKADRTLDKARTYGTVDD